MTHPRLSFWPDPPTQGVEPIKPNGVVLPGKQAMHWNAERGGRHWIDLGVLNTGPGRPRTSDLTLVRPSAR